MCCRSFHSYISVYLIINAVAQKYFTLSAMSSLWRSRTSVASTETQQLNLSFRAPIFRFILQKWPTSFSIPNSILLYSSTKLQQCLIFRSDRPFQQWLRCSYRTVSKCSLYFLEFQLSVKGVWNVFSGLFLYRNVAFNRERVKSFSRAQIPPLFGTTHAISKYFLHPR